MPSQKYPYPPPKKGMCTLRLGFWVREKKMTPVWGSRLIFEGLPLWGSRLIFWNPMCGGFGYTKYIRSLYEGFRWSEPLVWGLHGTYSKYPHNGVHEYVQSFLHTYSNLFELLIVILCENDQICPWPEIGIKVFYLDKLHTFLSWSRYFFNTLDLFFSSEIQKNW